MNHLRGRAFSATRSRNRWILTLLIIAQRVHGKYGERKIRECSVIFVILERENKYSGSLWQFVIFDSFKRKKTQSSEHFTPHSTANKLRGSIDFNHILDESKQVFSTRRCCCSRANIRKRRVHFLLRCLRYSIKINIQTIMNWWMFSVRPAVRFSQLSEYQDFPCSST